MNYRTCHRLFAVILGSALAMPALAGFDATRMTTVVDDFSGSYTVTTSSRIEGEGNGAEGIAQAEFSNFHARDERGSISGTLIDEFERRPGSVESIASAALTFERTDPASGDQRLLEISFDDLQIERNESGVEVSGEVSVNGELFDVSELPEPIGGLIRRVFWLIRR